MCLVNFDRTAYSVECRYVRQVATVRAYAERIIIVCGGEVAGEHPRCFERGQTLYNPWHYVAALARKPGALRNGRAVQGLEPAGVDDALAGAAGEAF